MKRRKPHIIKSRGLWHVYGLIGNHTVYCARDFHRLCERVAKRYPKERIK